MTNKVLVNFIQDRSGSMASVWQETLNGFAEFVKGLKEKADDVDYQFTLTVFDTLIETPLKTVPIKDVREDELAKYAPRGCTALYDAVGKTLEGTPLDGVDKVICIIVTDGQENSSREWSKGALNAAIDAKIKLGNWTFTYLGTQPETWADASSLGIGVGATATFKGVQAQATYKTMAHAVQAFSRSSDLCCANLMSSAYMDQDKAAQAGMRTKLTPPLAAKAAPVKSVSSKAWR